MVQVIQTQLLLGWDLVKTKKTEPDCPIFLGEQRAVGFYHYYMGMDQYLLIPFLGE
jgi:hypothetical protein